MVAFDFTFGTIHENIACDEALLRIAEETDAFECLRFWEMTLPAVVVGAGGSVVIDVNRTACEQDGVPIARRSSGGGTVLLSLGCLCFSLVLNYRRAVALKDVNASYRWILGQIQTALPRTELVTVSGICDLAIDGFKFSGNAQQRKSKSVLHHGTILYAAELSLISNYLNPPERMPDYRQGRPHNAFIRNVGMSRAEIITNINAQFAAPKGEMPPETHELVSSLVAEKYQQEEWIFRR